MVPVAHGIDSLGQFVAASLVNTTSVSPGVTKSFTSCLLATLLNLSETFLQAGRDGILIFERQFFMRKDSIFVCRIFNERLELQCRCVNKPHDRVLLDGTENPDIRAVLFLAEQMFVSSPDTALTALVSDSVSCQGLQT